jgi:hypothetical protein
MPPALLCVPEIPRPLACDFLWRRDDNPRILWRTSGDSFQTTDDVAHGAGNTYSILDSLASELLCRGP